MIKLLYSVDFHGRQGEIPPSHGHFSPKIFDRKQILADGFVARAAVV